MSKLLERLQNADEGTKRRWMIVATIIIMVVVIYIWAAYFNNLVAGFSQVQPTGPAVPAGTDFTFWATVRNGTAVLYRAFTHKLQALGGILNAPREYIVKPPM